MSTLSAPGLLYVFMETGTQVTEEELHEWYGAEHIPLRTKSLPEFRTAARYRAIDGATPKYAAIYTISDSSVFTNSAYTSLREKRSEREADVIKRLDKLDRRIYTLISDTTPLPESIRPSSIASEIIVSNSFTPKSGEEDAFNKWYEDDYVPAVKEVPGWVRTRRFKLVESSAVGLGVQADSSPKPPVYLEISEFDSVSSLRHASYPSDTAGSEVLANVEQTERRVLKLLEEFEPTAALRSIRTPAVV